MVDQNAAPAAQTDYSDPTGGQPQEQPQAQSQPTSDSHYAVQFPNSPVSEPVYIPKSLGEDAHKVAAAVHSVLSKTANKVVMPSDQRAAAESTFKQENPDITTKSGMTIPSITPKPWAGTPESFAAQLDELKKAVVEGRGSDAISSIAAAIVPALLAHTLSKGAPAVEGMRRIPESKPAAAPLESASESLSGKPEASVDTTATSFLRKQGYGKDRLEVPQVEVMGQRASENASSVVRHLTEASGAPPSADVEALIRKHFGDAESGVLEPAKEVTPTEGEANALAAKEVAGKRVPKVEAGSESKPEARLSEKDIQRLATSYTQSLRVKEGLKPADAVVERTQDLTAKAKKAATPAGKASVATKRSASVESKVSDAGLKGTPVTPEPNSPLMLEHPSLPKGLQLTIDKAELENMSVPEIRAKFADQLRKYQTVKNMDLPNLDKLIAEYGKDKPAAKGSTLKGLGAAENALSGGKAQE